MCFRLLPTVWEFFGVLPIVNKRLWISLVWFAGASRMFFSRVFYAIGSCITYIFDDGLDDLYHATTPRRR
ncbi:hypothetical protein EON65_16735 [archaeon]|nr:MAG: hypothetical protein EON65_16735 [archaeon]